MVLEEPMTPLNIFLKCFNVVGWMSLTANETNSLGEVGAGKSGFSVVWIINLVIKLGLLCSRGLTKRFLRKED